MLGSDDPVAAHAQLPDEHIEELGRIARGEDDGVTIDSVDFEFTDSVTNSCRCRYSIWGTNLQRLVGYSDSFQSHVSTNEDDVLQILQIFVGSATLECLSFRFKYLNPDDFDRLLRAVFSVVCTSRRLATVSFSWRGHRGCWLLAAESGVRHFLDTGFPVLLRDNHVICRLMVARERTTVEFQSSRPLALVGGPYRRLVCSISRNRVTTDSKAGWTLVSRTCDPDMIPQSERGSVLEMFALFPVDNALLKEVVLTRDWHRRGHDLCERPVETSRLVVRNVDALEQLDAGGYFFSSRDSTLAAEAVTRALRCDRSLKEFQYRCITLAELHELVRIFVPDRGRESNSSLSTLKVHVSGRLRMADCIIALAPLQGATVAALKQVVVCNYAKEGFTVMLMSESDDSEPHPDVECVTLSRLKVYFAQLWGWYQWDDALVLKSLTAIDEVLRMSTAVAHVEIVRDQFEKKQTLVLQRTGSCSDLHPNLPSSFSVLKLRLPLIQCRPIRSSEGAVARCWMTVIKALLRVVPTIERVEAVHDFWLAPCEFEKGMQGEVEKGLKRLLKKELRGNSCLQSLQVGWWHLVRVGAGDDEWDMSYDGPCLRRRDEYHVKVELQ